MLCCLKISQAFRVFRQFWLMYKHHTCRIYVKCCNHQCQACSSGCNSVYILFHTPVVLLSCDGIGIPRKLQKKRSDVVNRRFRCSEWICGSFCAGIYFFGDFFIILWCKRSQAVPQKGVYYAGGILS